MQEREQSWAKGNRAMEENPNIIQSCIFMFSSHYEEGMAGMTRLVFHKVGFILKSNYISLDFGGEVFYHMFTLSHLS